MHSVSGVTTRARALRNAQMPRTPEPYNAESESRPPSPPRQRLRLKRRNAPHLQAPTQNFLASVAAADVPIPSIEEPHVVDEEMIDSVYPVIHSLQDIDTMGYHQQAVRGRAVSQPKTPAPRAVPSLSPQRYPDWTIDSAVSDIESSPEYESSRPSTARSTQTSASFFSNFSVASEDLSQCLSPNDDAFDAMGQSDFQKEHRRQPRSNDRSRHARRAPWTKQMSQHVWFTYMMYLQDPKVTPFRAGKSGIPPAGVCSRVAREAKRSWKKSRTQGFANGQSGSLTPTGTTGQTFVQWPHTCAATRGHLRELCKLNAASNKRARQFHANSPTPFGQATSATRFLQRRSNPLRSPSVFSSSDMAMSLTVSTADSMQRQGPLAQLTSSQSEKPAQSSLLTAPTVFAQAPRTPPPMSRRLGSPFVAKSYGPSSSTCLTAEAGLSGEGPRHDLGMVSHHSLKSPVVVNESDPGSFKRALGQPVAETRKSRRRPSLTTDLWTEPKTSSASAEMNLLAAPVMPPNTEVSSADLTGPRANLAEIFEASQARAPQPTLASHTHLQHASEIARLGSPFGGINTSQSFPRRLFSASGLGGAMRRPFATVQEAAERPPTPPRSSLATRLAYIDERLRDLRQRERVRRRSQSPS